jgi:hypothetical protein
MSPLTLREKQRLHMFENRVLRKIFGAKRDEETASWRKLYNEGFHNFYSLSNIIRITKSRGMRWAGHIACTREARGEERREEK